MDKKKILIVDDDVDALECVDEILTRYGYESVPCTDASAALVLLASEVSLDLAITDLVMPEMNGLEFHEKIKQLRPGLPCIVVTGYSSVESYLHAINSGVFEYLNKPYRNRELIAIVAAALKRSVQMNGSGDRTAQYGQEHAAEYHHEAQ
jgi:DNA-binding NtrC family response regulator